jgi:hypothetical protein
MDAVVQAVVAKSVGRPATECRAMADRLEAVANALASGRETGAVAPVINGEAMTIDQMRAAASAIRPL